MPRSSLSDVSSSDTSSSLSSTGPITRTSPRRKIRIPRRYSSASASTSTSSSTYTPSSPSPSSNNTPLSLSTLDTAHITAHHLVTADDLLVRVFDKPRSRLRVDTIGKQTVHDNHVYSCSFTTSFHAAFKNHNDTMRLHQRAQEFTKRVQDQGLIDRDASTASAFSNLCFRYANLYQSSRVQMSCGIINTKMQARIVATADIPRGVLIHELDGLMSGDGVDFDECSSCATSIANHRETSDKRKRKREPQYNMFSVIRKTPQQCGPALADRLLVGPARFVNHACKPNCRLKPFSKTNAWGIETLRDISADEEITVSYGKAYFGPGECACASCQVVLKDTELGTTDMDASEQGAASSKNNNVIEKRTCTYTDPVQGPYPTPPADPAELEDSARPRKKTRTR